MLVMLVRSAQPLILTLLGGLIACGGCHALSPKVISPSQQYISPELVSEDNKAIEIGRPIKWLDKTGWVLGIPGKLTLWDRRIDNHSITEPTVETAAEYLQANNLPHLKIRMNQYAPIEDFRRLRKNKIVAWPYRYTMGLVSLSSEALLPGRFFGGDHFNPYTQTVHIYSDSSAIVLHELGHAKDFARRKYQGTYALGYAFFPLWHETIASREAMGYLYEHDNREGIIEANRLLYPAYGTYVGNGIASIAPGAALPIFYGSVLAGHINGRMLSRKIDEDLRRYHEMFSSNPNCDTSSSSKQSEFAVDVGQRHLAPNDVSVAVLMPVGGAAGVERQ